MTDGQSSLAGQFSPTLTVLAAVTGASAFSYGWSRLTGSLSESIVLPVGTATLVLASLLSAAADRGVVGLRWGATGRQWRAVTAALAVVTVAVMSFRLLGTSAPYEPSVGEFLLVPVGEELLFRGLLLGFLLGTFARAEVPHTAAWAVVASAMAFGVGHLGNLGYVDSRFVVLQVFVAAAFGVLAGWLRIRTDSIAGPVLLHMVMNTLAVAG